MEFPTTYSYAILLSPHIYLTSLFSNTLSLCSYICGTNQISKSYKITGKITVVYILRLGIRQKKKMSLKAANIPGIKSAH